MRLLEPILHGAFMLTLAAVPVMAQSPATPEPAFSPSELDALFEEADRDNDGALSQNEFKIAAVLLSETPEQMRQR